MNPRTDRPAAPLHGNTGRHSRSPGWIDGREPFPPLLVDSPAGCGPRPHAERTRTIELRTRQHSDTPHEGRTTAGRLRTWAKVGVLTSTIAVAVAGPAAAAETTTTTTKPGAPPPDLKAVVDGFQTWLLAFSTGLAILALTVAGVFYLFSAGNPAQVERAKLIVRATVIGYSLMVLAPVVLRALQAIVG
jgi:hypothetical protein